MTLATHLPALLAQLSRSEELGRKFRGANARVGADDALMVLVLLTVGIGVLVLLSQLLKLQERDRPCNNPKKLFRKLCQLHGLDRKSRNLLWELATHQSLDHPARLFLEPARFNPENVGPTLSEHQAEFNTLRGRLFAAR